jgi:glutathione S-transferase
MLTFYHAPQSRSSRILWLIEELGADCEIVYSDISRRDGTGAADPKNPHPDKKVPALVHDGVLITESIAVAQYLADLHPEAGLAPQMGDPDRGPYLSWLAYYAGVVEPVMHFDLVGQGDNPVLMRTFRTRADIDRRILTALEKGPYLLGERFSTVDIIIASVAFWFRDALPEGEIVDAYIERCGDRPARQAAMEKDSPPIAA